MWQPTMFFLELQIKSLIPSPNDESLRTVNKLKRKIDTHEKPSMAKLTVQQENRDRCPT
jgi:hypothetical protein